MIHPIPWVEKYQDYPAEREQKLKSKSEEGV